MKYAFFCKEMIKTKYQSALLSFKFSWSDSSGAASKIMDNQSTYLFEGWSKQLCWMLVISLKYYWDMILTYKYSTQHAGFWIEITGFFAKLWSFHISNLSKSCCLNAQLIYINSKMETSHWMIGGFIVWQRESAMWLTTDWGMQ